jgi:RNA polymerase sigma-70 factor (ECF subfamily)
VQQQAGYEGRDDPEASLVRAATEGADGLRDLYRCYMPRVYAYVAYRTGAVPETEDIVSETFLRVAKDLRRFRYRGQGSFAAWLFRIAHNVIEDQRRLRRRRGLPLPLEAAEEVADDSPPPGEDLERQERSEELRVLVATLPPQRQKVVLLRFFAGLRNREIAKVLRLDERTVASHLSRGIQELQRKYVSSEEPSNAGAFEPVTSPGSKVPGFSGSGGGGLR